MVAMVQGARCRELGCLMVQGAKLSDGAGS